MLQAIDEPLELMEYNRWNVIVPEGQFLTEVGNSQFEEVLAQVSPAGIPEWQVSTIFGFMSSHLSVQMLWHAFILLCLSFMLQNDKE